MADRPDMTMRRICIICGDGLPSGRSHNAITCSAECAKLRRVARDRVKYGRLLADPALRDTRNARRRGHLATKREAHRKVKNCIECGASLAGRSSRAKTCSSNCKSKHNNRLYWAANKARLTEVNKQWRRRNPERVMANSQKQYVEMAAARDLVREFGFRSNGDDQNETGKSA